MNTIENTDGWPTWICDIENHAKAISVFALARNIVPPNELFVVGREIRVLNAGDLFKLIDEAYKNV